MDNNLVGAFAFYNFYNKDAFLFGKHLAEKLDATIHLDFNNQSDLVIDLPEKTFINFFRSDLYYVQIHYYKGTDQSLTGAYILYFSTGKKDLDELGIYFLPNGVVRVFDINFIGDWFGIVDYFIDSNVSNSYIISPEYIELYNRFKSFLLTIGCSHFYLFSQKESSFLPYVSSVFCDLIEEQNLLNYMAYYDKIKIYTTSDLIKLFDDKKVLEVEKKSKKLVEESGVIKVEL